MLSDYSLVMREKNIFVHSSYFIFIGVKLDLWTISSIVNFKFPFVFIEVITQYEQYKFNIQLKYKILEDLGAMCPSF